MTWSDHYKNAASYNKKVNDQLLSVCRNLSCDSMLQDRGVFFDSIIGTWNHLLVSDLLWLQQLNMLRDDNSLLQHQPAIISPNQVIAAQLDEVSELRLAIDNCLIHWIDQLCDEQLAQQCQYKTLDDQTITTTLDQVLQHIFNHQIHHRGQLSALLSQAGVSYGHIDLLQPKKDVVAGASG